MKCSRKPPGAGLGKVTLSPDGDAVRGPIAMFCRDIFWGWATPLILEAKCQMPWWYETGTHTSTKYPRELRVQCSWEKDEPEASRLNDTIQPAPTGFGTFGNLVISGTNLVFELVDPLLAEAWSWWLELFGRWSNLQATGHILKVKGMKDWVDWHKCHWDYVCFQDGLVWCLLVGKP